MIDRLETIQKRYDEIANELSNPSVVSDIKKMTELSKEQRRLTPIVEIYKKYKKALEDIETAKEMLKDADMEVFAKEEIGNLNKEIEDMEKEQKKSKKEQAAIIEKQKNLHPYEHYL